MESLTLRLSGMANGGAALGRDDGGRVIFVPFTIPGERVRVELLVDKERFAQARLLDILDSSPARTTPRCPHFGVCGGCAYQHIRYEAQLAYKREIVADQLQRIGGLEGTPIQPVLPHPAPWNYLTDVTFSPAAEGGLGFWSPAEKRVIPIQECHLISPKLSALFDDIDLELPGLRSLTLRQGADGELLVALAVDGAEPPQLKSDLPVSIALVLPNGQAASLVGDNYFVQRVGGKDFRVSPGAFFYPSPEMNAQLVEVVVEYAALSGRERLVEGYAGVGMFSAFLAPHAAAIQAVEINPDAVADAVLNLAETENVELYEGAVEEVFPLLEPAPDLLLVDPDAGGLSKTAMQALLKMHPRRLLYVSEAIATLARDGRRLQQAGYEPVAVQPLDMYPHTPLIFTVSLWESRTTVEQRTNEQRRPNPGG